MKHLALYIVRNPSTGALYTPVPVDYVTADAICRACRRQRDRLNDPWFWLDLVHVGYGIPYVGVFRR